VRNPKVDPQEGDELYLGAKSIVVDMVKDGMVHYRLGGDGDEPEASRCTIELWRQAHEIEPRWRQWWQGLMDDIGPVRPDGTVVPKVGRQVEEDES